jgi:hypothetical protein
MRCISGVDPDPPDTAAGWRGSRAGGDAALSCGPRARARCQRMRDLGGRSDRGWCSSAGLWLLVLLFVCFQQIGGEPSVTVGFSHPSWWWARADAGTRSFGSSCRGLGPASIFGPDRGFRGSVARASTRQLQPGKSPCRTGVMMSEELRARSAGQERIASDWVVRQRIRATEYERPGLLPWTHFLELSALRTIGAVSPVEEKLAEWRAGSLAGGASAWTATDAVLGSKKRDLLTAMKWERVLSAEVDVCLKLSLWKSQARARRQQLAWNVDNALLSLDFERNAANLEHLSLPRVQPTRLKNNMVPGRKAASVRDGVREPPLSAPQRTIEASWEHRRKPVASLRRRVWSSGQNRTENTRQMRTESIASYTREVMRASEQTAFRVGTQLLADMEREHVRPTTIFFNALLAACTGKGVASGVGANGNRGGARVRGQQVAGRQSDGQGRRTVHEQHDGGMFWNVLSCVKNRRNTKHSIKKTAHEQHDGQQGRRLPHQRRRAAADGAGFEVRRSASTSASRAAVAAGRSASRRWRECGEVLRLMQEHRVAPDTATMNVLVDACVKQGGRGMREAAHVEQALDILRAFTRSCTLTPDVVTYTSLLNGCAAALRDCPQIDTLEARVSHPSSMYATHQDGLPSSPPPSASPGSVPAAAAQEASDDRVARALRVAAAVYEGLAASNVAPNLVLSTAMLDFGVHVILRSPPGSQSQALGKSVCQATISHMRELQVLEGEAKGACARKERSLSYALNVVLRALLRQQGPVTVGEEMVMEIVETLLFEGAEPDVISYNMLLHRLLPSNHVKAHLAAATGHASAASLEVGYGGTLAAIKSSLVARAHRRRTGRAAELMAHMHTCNVAPDVVTYTTLLNICAASARSSPALVSSARLVCAAMRCDGIKPNAATSAAFAAGFLAVSARTVAPPSAHSQQQPSHGEEDALAGVHAPCSEGSEEGLGRLRSSDGVTLHAVGVDRGGGAVLAAPEGPRAAEVMRALLALNMRPDAASCSALLRVAAGMGVAQGGGGGGLRESVRLMEAMRGAGAVPTREWYVLAAAGAVTVTEAVFVVHLSRMHLQSAMNGEEAAEYVAEQLVRCFCRRCDLTGLAQGWAVVLSQHAARLPVRGQMLTLLLEGSKAEGSAAAAQLALKLLVALDGVQLQPVPHAREAPPGEEERGVVGWSSSHGSWEQRRRGRYGRSGVPRRVWDSLVQVLLAAGLSEEASHVQQR